MGDIVIEVHYAQSPRLATRLCRELTGNLRIEEDDRYVYVGIQTTTGHVPRRLEKLLGYGPVSTTLSVPSSDSIELLPDPVIAPIITYINQFETALSEDQRSLFLAGDSPSLDEMLQQVSMEMGQAVSVDDIEKDDGVKQVLYSVLRVLFEVQRVEDGDFTAYREKTREIPHLLYSDQPAALLAVQDQSRKYATEFNDFIARSLAIIQLRNTITSHIQQFPVYTFISPERVETILPLRYTAKPTGIEESFLHTLRILDPNMRRGRIAVRKSMNAIFLTLDREPFGAKHPEELLGDAVDEMALDRYGVTAILRSFRAPYQDIIGKRRTVIDTTAPINASKWLPTQKQWELFSYVREHGPMRPCEIARATEFGTPQQIAGRLRRLEGNGVITSTRKSHDHVLYTENPDHQRDIVSPVVSPVVKGETLTVKLTNKQRQVHESGITEWSSARTIKVQSTIRSDKSYVKRILSGLVKVGLWQHRKNDQGHDQWKPK